MTTIRRFGNVALVIAMLSLASCATNPWKDSFQIEPGGLTPAGDSADAEDVRVREVSWERVKSTRDELQSLAAASDVHPSEWTETKKQEAKSLLLRGFQYTEDPARVDVLGRSEFAVTDGADTGASLREFAASIGATDVAWSAEYLGKADKIVSEPVTTYTTGSWPRWSDRSQRGGTYSETSTTYVPVRVTADRWGYVAIFLRINR